MNRILPLVFLILFPFIFSVAAATYVQKGKLALVNPPPNAHPITFLFERRNSVTQISSFIQISTNSSGYYTAVFDDCVIGQWNLYTPRIILVDGSLSSPQWSVFNGCFEYDDGTYAVDWAQIRDGSRYNAGDTCSIESVGQPVNVTNGNMWLNQSDYSLGEIGPRIEIVRTYNSANQTPGMFGHGWTSSFDMKLSSISQALIQLDMGNGRVVNFANNGLSEYLAVSPNIYGKIVPSGTQYLLTLKDRISSQFSNTGLLLWSRDRNGSQLTFTYDTNNHLTEVTDSFGRSIKLVTDGFGRITQVTDAMGIVASYEYDPSGTYLGEVTYGDGSKYTFEYVSAGGRVYLRAVRDALDNILETHEYDSEGRAWTSEKDGGQERFEFDYSNWNSTSSYTLVKHKKHASDQYIETKYYFDRSRGRNVVVKTEGSCDCGGGISETTEYIYDTKLNLVKRIDETDALPRETTYTYDANGNVLSEVDIFGTQKWTYNSLDQVLTYKDRIHSQNPDPTVTTILNSYDPSGNLLTTKNALNYVTTMT